MAITNQDRVGKAMELLRAGLAPADLPADWDPATDPRLTAWAIARLARDGGQSHEVQTTFDGNAE